jgi:hypothetical protein
VGYFVMHVNLIARLNMYLKVMLWYFFYTQQVAMTR